MYDVMVISVKIIAEIICEVLYYVGWQHQCFINKPMRAMRHGLESYSILFCITGFKKIKLLELYTVVFRW